MARSRIGNVAAGVGNPPPTDVVASTVVADTNTSIAGLTHRLQSLPAELFTLILDHTLQVNIGEVVIASGSFTPLVELQTDAWSRVKNTFRFYHESKFVFQNLDSFICTCARWLKSLCSSHRMHLRIIQTPMIRQPLESEEFGRWLVDMRLRYLIPWQLLTRGIVVQDDILRGEFWVKGQNGSVKIVQM